MRVQRACDVRSIALPARHAGDARADRSRVHVGCLLTRTKGCANPSPLRHGVNHRSVWLWLPECRYTQVPQRQLAADVRGATFHKSTGNDLIQPKLLPLESETCVTFLTKRSLNLIPTNLVYTKFEEIFIKCNRFRSNISTFTSEWTTKPDVLLKLNQEPLTCWTRTQNKLC